MFKKLFVSLALACSAFAGQMSIDVVKGSESLVITEHLTKLDSSKFLRAASGDYKDSLLLGMYGKGAFEKYPYLVMSWVNAITFESNPEYNESLTVSVIKNAVNEGDNTIPLKDIKSIDFIEMDDALDSDGDGYTDVNEIFVMNSDPNKFTHSSAAIKEISYYNAKNEKVGDASKMTSFSTDPLTVEVVTEEPVYSVEAAFNGTSVGVTVEDAQHFKFSIPPLKVAEEKEVSVLVVSETKKKLNYSFKIPSGFTAYDALSLSTSDHQSIEVNFAPTMTDTRITGYVILRAEGSSSANNKALENLSLSSDKALKDQLPSGVTIVKELDDTSLKNYTWVSDDVTLATYTDNVSVPSPYYTYRVVAYVKENINGKDVYSYKMTVAKTRRVGHIKFSFKAVEFGTEYFTVKALRSDMRLFADFYNGSSVTKKYNYWFKNAGVSLLYPNTFAWETKADEDNSDNNAVDIDTKQYTMDVGKDGVKLVLKNNADKNGTTVSASQTITWSYDNFVKVLNGQMSATGKSGNAPKKGRNVFTYGVGGVSYDDNCGSGCGDEPHAGWKFDFDYGWDD